VNIKAGNLQVAEDYLRRAVRINPNCGSSLYNLGHLLEQTGRHAEAVEQWEKAAKTRNNEKAADYWGQYLVRQGRVTEAIQWFRAALNIRPEFIEARFHLVTALSLAGNTQEAMTHLQYILKIDPQNKETLDMLAKIEDQGRIDPNDENSHRSASVNGQTRD
jgi:protein O-GlcNAc transferase